MNFPMLLVTHGRRRQVQAAAHVSLIELDMVVDLAAMLEGFGAHLRIAGSIALMDGLQAAPLQTLGRPGRGVSERGAERLVAAEVLARQVHVAVGAGEIELATAR